VANFSLLHVTGI